ncbi:MAG: response regulator transcription factor [Anaerolineaceae bacterium]|jgi:NarL family two-component system response regulator LiaR|nr:response regulator transcription factor [Anaerolineaceae bacterium]
MSIQSIKLLVVDDQSIVRKGICALLEQVDDIDVIGEASDGEEAVAQAKLLRPDVILMDLVMPKMDGITAIKNIMAAQPGMRIMALTSFVAEDKVFPAIKAGAMGYLLKDSEPEALIVAIRDLNRGEPSLHPTVAKMVLEELSQPARQPLTPDPLTDREEDVVRLVAQGLSNRQIAEHLIIGEATVRTHVGNILNKLHLANRVQATLYALRVGLTSLDEIDKADDE